VLPAQPAKQAKPAQAAPAAPAAQPGFTSPVAKQPAFKSKEEQAAAVQMFQTMQSPDTDAAIKAGDSFLQKFPDSEFKPVALYFLTISYQSKNDYEKTLTYGEATLKADPGKLVEQWRDENVEYDFVRQDWIDENVAFELKAHPPLGRLPSFQQGLFYVQDPSTLLAVRELNAQAGESVLDLSAAPGGKLPFLAQLMRNEGRLVAHDTAPERLKLIEQNCPRLGVTGVHTILPAALAPHPSAGFDRILIDAPCSNTGVMRRRVDLRWRIRLEEIGRLRATQLELLGQAAPLLKAGGTLVYSTCSLEPEENSELVAEFLNAHADFKLEGTRELLPFEDGVDGTYVARMVKNR